MKAKKYLVEYDELEQIQLLKKHGEYLAEREDEKHTYKLYKLYSFYVEKRYMKDGNLLNGLDAFEVDDIMLNPYLDQIKININ